MVPRFLQLKPARTRAFSSSRQQLFNTPASNRGEQSGTHDIVQVEYRGVEFEARKGARLRTAMLKAGVSPHNGDARLINCRGLGTCGTCAVQISGDVTPAEWTTQEKLRLNFPPHRPPNNQRLRLACQVKLQGDAQIIKYNQFWGQGDLPLGSLQESPQQQPRTGVELGTSVNDQKTATVATKQGETAEEPQSRLGLGISPLGDLEFVLDPDARKI